MSKLCSVCMLQSPKKLTPLFTKNGNYWQSTGLSEMLETVLNRKILQGRESVLTICTKCVYKITKLFYENNSMPMKNVFNFLTKEIPVLAALIQEDSCQEKISPAYELQFKPVKPVNDQRKKLKTAEDELKKIKFKVQEKVDYINCLPLECLSKIFMFLSLPERVRMGRVCKRWSEANTTTWQNIKELDLYKDFHPSDRGRYLEKLLFRCGGYLEKLKIECEISDLNFISVVKNYCQNLKKIVVTSSGWQNNDCFIDIFSKMKTLEEVILCTYNHDDQIPLNFVRMFSTLRTGVERIKIIHCHNSTERAPLHFNVQWAFNKFYALKCLSLEGLKLDEKAMDGISKKKTLVQLEFKDCEFSSKAQLTDPLPNLEIFKFTDNEGGIVNLSNSINCCKNLKKLNLSSHMTAATFNELKELKHLESFRLEYMDRNDNNVIGILAKSCPNLKHLDLRCKIHFNEVDFGFRNLGNLKNLEHLTLRCMKKINDHHLSIVAVECKKLKYLDLFGCRGVSNFGLQKLKNLMNLEFLNLEGIEHIDNSVIFSIRRNCMRLKTLITVSDVKNMS